jgi:hypothetical protein
MAAALISLSSILKCKMSLNEHGFHVHKRRPTFQLLIHFDMIHQQRCCDCNCNVHAGEKYACLMEFNEGMLSTGS